MGLDSFLLMHERERDCQAPGAGRNEEHHTLRPHDLSMIRRQ
jgi:hypothetical protein